MSIKPLEIEVEELGAQDAEFHPVDLDPLKVQALRELGQLSDERLEE